MPDTSEVWLAKDVLRLSEGYAPDSRVGNALRAFAAQLGDREREDGAGRAAATALQADIRSALGVKTTPGALKAARSILAGHPSAEVLTAAFGVIIARDTRVYELLQVLKAMRTKYGMYACAVCDMADAEIARAESGT